jgi:hypothetical protein
MREMLDKHGIEHLDSIRDTARAWFHNHKVLLVLGNVFPVGNNSTPRYWVHFLKQALGHGSCLLLSRDGSYC